MKLVVLACLAVVALAAPQEPRPVETILDERRDDGDGHFAYEFETENGIYQNIVGSPGDAGGQNMQGSFRFPLDDGTIAEYNFIANENGYQPESDLIPKPHPLPDHVLRTLELVENLVAQGATWNDQGERVTRRRQTFPAIPGDTQQGYLPQGIYPASSTCTLQPSDATARLIPQGQPQGPILAYPQGYPYKDTSCL